MGKEHKIFLSICGSILAVVAIAIILSINSGGSFAESSSDYYCEGANNLVLTAKGYGCCPTSYGWAQGADVTGDEGWGMCTYKVTNDFSGTCPNNGTQYEVGPWAGYCVLRPTAASEKNYACYYCGASNSYLWNYTRPDGCTSIWTTVSGVTSEEDCGPTNNNENNGNNGSDSELGCLPNTTYYVNTPSGLNCRSGPGSSYSVVSTKPNCSAVTVCKYNNNYWYSSDSCYLSAGYFSSTMPESCSNEVVKYTVTYDANGGTGAPSSQEKAQGVDLVLSTTKPTRDNYTFVKWNTKSDGTGTTYYSGSTYSADNDVTLYAVWRASTEEADTYTITYNANGGKNSPQEQIIDKDDEAILRSTKPMRDGYKFVKWNTKSDGSGDSYSPGDTYSDGEDLTLYAIWELLAENNITSTDKTDEEIENNAKTGSTIMIVAWITAFAALCFTVLYFKRKSDF